MSAKRHIIVGLLVAFLVCVVWYGLLVFADTIGIDARSLSDVSVYMTTAAWIFMAWGAFIDCFLEERTSATELKRARALDLYVLIRAASDNHERALLMLIQALMKLMVGMVAGYLLYQIGPDPDYSPVQMALRVFFMLDIYWFWQTKRKDRARRRYINGAPIGQPSAPSVFEQGEEALQIEQARDEVTAEIRENRRVFAEVGKLVLDKLEEIEKRLNGSR